MTIAEKYYRLFYKVKPETKLTNEQWKVVNMMHQCLKENNKPKLPMGTILVNKKALFEHTNCIIEISKGVDAAMKEKESYERGKKIAQLMNRLDLTNDHIRHFELKIPLKKVKNQITK